MMNKKRGKKNGRIGGREQKDRWEKAVIRKAGEANALRVSEKR